MSLSFIIPAYNEQVLLPATLVALHAAARALARPYEIVVADDGSTDGTAAAARAQGARVVSAGRRQIAAARNAGARAARGELLVFVDADTQVPPTTLRAVVRAVERGAVGGGARVVFDDLGPVRRQLAAAFTAVWFSLLRWAAGCFIFARRDALAAVGGFDERYYIGEEMVLSRALKRHGRFVIVRPAVVTSARKMTDVPLASLLRDSGRLLVQGPRAWQRRSGLELWYEPRGRSAPG